jgi:16S rRNA (uracil1498-N3)-methyltransferase
MPLPFFYTAPIPPSDNIVVLNEENSKHIVQVLRMQNGKQIKLTDGLGNIFLAEITDAHKKKCSVKIIERSNQESPENKVCIAVSPVKNNSRLEWFLEKATEIGVSEIVLLMCERTEKQNIRLDRMKGILISAMLQSQQAWLPILEEPKKYASFVKTVKSENKFIAHCEENKKTSLKEITNQLTNPVRTDVHPGGQSTILIGPEGDFTPQEIALALENNFTTVALGNTRLRTETAALVAATLLCVQ